VLQQRMIFEFCLCPFVAVNAYHVPSGYGVYSVIVIGNDWSQPDLGTVGLYLYRPLSIYAMLFIYEWGTKLVNSETKGLQLFYYKICQDSEANGAIVSQFIWLHHHLSWHFTDINMIVWSQLYKQAKCRTFRST